MDEFKWLRPLLDAVGPTATAFALVAAVLFFFYRRDLIRKEQDSRADRADLMTVVAKNTQSTDKLTEAIGRLAESSARQIETIVRAFERRERDGRDRRDRER